MQYSIGQVLFVVLNKKNQIYPMRVVEVITKKTLKGEEVRFVLQGGSDSSTTVMLDQVDGEIFDTAEKARVTLSKRATAQIGKMVDVAVEKAKQWYGVSEAEPPRVQELPEPLSLPATEDEDEEPTVMLPDGTVVKVKMPKVNAG